MTAELNHVPDDDSDVDEGFFNAAPITPPRQYDAARARETIIGMFEAVTAALESLAAGRPILESEGTPLLHDALDAYARPIVAARDLARKQRDALLDAVAWLLAWNIESGNQDIPKPMERRINRALEFATVETWKAPAEPRK